MRTDRKGITVYTQETDLGWVRYYCKERVIVLGLTYTFNRFYTGFTNLRLAITKGHILLQFSQMKD